MKLKRPLFALTFLAVAVLFVNTVYGCYYCRPGLSPGYWKHNVNVYCGGHGSYSGDPHETDATMKGYETYIKAHGHPTFTLEWANERFQDNQYKSMWLTIANWFNRAAGRSPYSG